MADKILVFYGSYRSDRMGIRLADYVVAGLKARGAEAERDGADQQGEPAELEREQELADELAPVGVGRLDGRDDRLAGQDHHVPNLLEQALRG